MNRNERMRALAAAIIDGSARPAEIQALAQWVLDDLEPRPMTDGELAALGALAIAEETAMARANGVREAQGQAPAYGEDARSDATVRLGMALRHRGIIVW